MCRASTRQLSSDARLFLLWRFSPPASSSYFALRSPSTAAAMPRNREHCHEGFARFSQVFGVKEFNDLMEFVDQDCELQFGRKDSIDQVKLR